MAKQKFQTPSAGRWVLQLCVGCSLFVIYGCFKPHQRGGGCCSNEKKKSLGTVVTWFQTPSAGRWVLQLG